MAKQDGSTRGTPAGIDAARAAMAEGDHRSARRHARAVLADPALATFHDEARRIDAATTVDTAPIIAGAIVLAVLVVLFWYALSHANAVH